MSASCASGECVYTCLADFLDCDGQTGNGCEANLLSSNLHCGSCKNKCGTAAHATAQCTQGLCKSACDAGWADCGGGDGDGCETETDGSIEHCGGCATVCSGGDHAKPLCDGGTCTFDCDAGFADCNGLASDGCEAAVTSDATHCGSCGIQCGGGKCVKGACECAATSHSAQLIPLDMYIMVDQSSSMSEPTGTGATRWQAVAEAIEAFVSDPKSAGLGVGIQYFPLKPGGKTSCVAGDYAKPEVAIAALPDNAQAITASIEKHGPTPSTPTYPALQGAVTYATAHATAHPTHTVAVVLATDGEPTQCAPLDIPTIAAVAAKGAAAAPKVRTFVIGVGTSLGNLDAIAAAGGSQQSFLVDAGGNVVQQFELALAAIQGQALACAYEIPKPEGGLPTQFDKVNVQVTLGAKAAAVLPYVADAASCDPQKGGWHYDDAGAPTQIVLCPQSCGAVKGDGLAQVDVMLGCARAGEP